MAAAASLPPTKTCNSRNRAGGACGLPAGWGTDHAGVGRCKLHGGSAPNGKIQAANLRVAQLVEASPTTGVAAIDRALAVLNGLVGALEREIAGGPLVSSAGELNGLVRQLVVASRDLAQIGKLAADANIDERRIVIDEQLGEVIADVIRGVLTDLGIPIDDHVADVVELRLVEHQAAA